MSTRLANYLFHENPEVVLEAARALGNLTRCEAVVDALCSTRAAEIMVMLLNSSDFDILLAVTGALVNVSSDSRSLGCLAESEKPAQSLATVLRRSSFKNLQLSILVCQASAATVDCFPFLRYQNASLVCLLVSILVSTMCMSNAFCLILCYCIGIS